MRQLKFHLKRISLILASMLLILLSGTQSTDAQRIIDRNLLFNPLADTSVEIQPDERKVFPSVGGWATFGNYGVHRDTHHLWYHELGTYLELFRVGDQRSLAFTTQIEFIADPHNDINFNPRAIFWEEGFLYTSNRGGAYLQLGFYHRCKHDIDNLEIGQERSITFGSALARVLIPFSILGNRDAMLGIQFDNYLISWEGRTPDNLDDISPNWGNMGSSAMLNFSWQHSLGELGKLHFNSYGMTTMIDAEFIYNGRAQLEIGAATSRADARFGIFVERLGDSGIPAEPSGATLVGIGLRAMTPGSLR